MPNTLVLLIEPTKPIRVLTKRVQSSQRTLENEKYTIKMMKSGGIAKIIKETQLRLTATTNLKQLMILKMNISLLNLKLIQMRILKRTVLK